MFQVKGWKISAPLKTDTSKALLPTDEQAAASKSKSLKRKRAHDKNKAHGNGIQVTDSTLGDLWSQHIEGRPKTNGESPPERVKKQRKRNKDALKKQTVDDEVPQSAPPALPSVDTEPAAVVHPKRAATLVETQDKSKRKDNKRRKKGEWHTRHGVRDNADVSPAVLPTPEEPPQAPEPTALPIASKLTSLQSKMSHKLASARFRHLNEQLYTTPSSHSLALFEQSPSMFSDYHIGFSQQVAIWPENPVDGYIEDIVSRGQVHPDRHRKDTKKDGKISHKDATIASPKTSPAPLPRSRAPPQSCTIADLGCGTAGLATALQPHLAKLKLKIHSFDLSSPSPLVTRADVSNLPLKDGEVDVAIFCLALMGTNWPSFIEEAWRVLRWRGELWIAEIRSRFARPRQKGAGAEGNNLSKRKMKMQQRGPGKKTAAEKEEKENEQVLAVEVDGVEDAAVDTDVMAFVKVLERRGFVLQGEPDLRNRMFVKMKFLKDAVPSAGRHMGSGAERQIPKGHGGGKRFVDKAEVVTSDEASVLKPCVYKLR